MVRAAKSLLIAFVAIILLTACLPVGGFEIPDHDLPGWELIFADDFNYGVPLGSFPDAVSDRWGAYNEGWSDTSGNGTYSPHRVNWVGNGVLYWEVHTDPLTGEHLVSVPYPLLPGANSQNGMQSGRYAVRFTADARHLHEYKTAWLLWPEPGTWPEDGEIDFPEGDLDSTISAFVHHEDGCCPNDQTGFFTSTTYNSWHIAVIEWISGTSVKFFLDNELVGETTTRVPDGSMRWVLQTETALNGIEPSDLSAGQVMVDWVAVWKPA